MKIKEIEQLEPKDVFCWFKKICSIPHGSYHEEAISKWLSEECKKGGCEVKVYPSGMILAKQKATPGCENWPVVLLQSHMDMVLAKTESCTKDLTKEPIEPYYDTETGMVHAEQTSLGADDGIGVAMQLAIINDPKIIHGPLEHLFTVNEEDHPGECIDNDLKTGDLKAKYYINLDGETPHEIIYAGSGCSTMKFNCPIEQIDNDKQHTFSISISGFSGGHSGVSITRPHINPIVFLAQCCIDFNNLNDTEFEIAKFEGGPINNALPIYAKLNVVMESELFEKFKRFLLNQLLIAKRVAQGTEDKAILQFKEVENAKKVYSKETTKRIMMFATYSPNKVFASELNTGLMFSSSNLGYINVDNGNFKIDFKVRSYLDGEIQRTIRKIEGIAKFFNFQNYKQEGRISSFLSNLSHNKLSEVYSQSYAEIFGKPAKKVKVPGGLECASVCLKNKVMEDNTISIGANLTNCHSPLEGMDVADTVKTWKVIKVVLSKLNS